VVISARLLYLVASGNPPSEASPDYAYKPYKGSKVEVEGGCQMEEAAGLVPSLSLFFLLQKRELKD